MISNVSFGRFELEMENPRLAILFFPPFPMRMWERITPQQASTALRSYLTTGNPRWDLAVAS